MENMIKIQIKTIFGNVLFEYEKKDNTIAATLKEAVRLRKDLRDADFWNNNSEFPNNGDEASKFRILAYNTAKAWFDIVNNQ